MNTHSRITRLAFPLFACSLFTLIQSLAANTNAVPETVTQNSQPETRNQKPETRNPEPATRNQKPETRNAKPETRNAKPETRNPEPGAQLREQDTDEIDLEEIDDSADAAKKALIKSAPKDVGYVDISCDEATLADVLRQFRKTTQANIIFDDSTNLLKRVSASLTHVPWKDALQSILKTRNFRLDERNGIYFVMEDIETIPILTKSFTLNHAAAEELATLFNENYGVKDAKGNVIKKIANAFSGANVVVVTAPEKTILDCEAIIKSIDKAVAQIYIEARFLELSSDALHKLGIQWDSLASWKVSASGLKAGWESNRGEAANYGEVTTQRSLTKSTSQTSSQSTQVSGNDMSASSSTSSSPTENSTQTLVGLVPGAIGAAGRAGIDAADMAWRNASGFSGQLSAQDFALALSAFESLNEGKIFSNPKVIVSNGKEATVDMTTKFPNVDVSSQRSTSTANPYTDISTRIQVIPGDKDKVLFAGDIFYSWGITLSVKPRISPDGLISVVITPTISQLDTTSHFTDEGFYKVGSGAGSSENANTSTFYSKYPVIEMKRITTEFTMKDGATAVIGGLSKTEEEDIDSGIPYLRKLPWIGQKLFGWKSRAKIQKEIIVCVTIGIADPADLPKDMGLPQNAIIGREYVNGKRLEPGQRKGSADEILALDTEDLDKQHEKRAAEHEQKTDKSAPQEKGNFHRESKPAQTQRSTDDAPASDDRLAAINLGQGRDPSYGSVSVKFSSVQ